MLTDALTPYTYDAAPADCSEKIRFSKHQAAAFADALDKAADEIEKLAAALGPDYDPYEDGDDEQDGELVMTFAMIAPEWIGDVEELREYAEAFRHGPVTAKIM